MKSYFHSLISSLFVILNLILPSVSAQFNTRFNRTSHPLIQNSEVKLNILNGVLECISKSEGVSDILFNFVEKAIDKPIEEIEFQDIYRNAKNKSDREIIMNCQRGEFTKLIHSTTPKRRMSRSTNRFNNILSQLKAKEKYKIFRTLANRMMKHNAALKKKL